MSMLDSFFNKGFRAAKCKTLLKLSIPRIKLLRNRREIQIKQMRRDIAKLLETGQEATARIRVEHIIREENMMAAQEILELYCELIAVRLPIIETQRECPLDLKEAISSLCFAAPRCADLPELLQVQLLFASKYGKEFVSAATELMPDCGVSRQLIELLSVRAPSPDTKLKLLREIAEEHDLDWDPAATETEFSKPHEDLLNGSTQFVSGSKIPLPKEKHDETLYKSEPSHTEKEDSDTDFDLLDLPEVPKASLRPFINDTSEPTISIPIPPATPPEISRESSKHSEDLEYLSKETHLPSEDIPHEPPVVNNTVTTPNSSLGVKEEYKQFLPFISPPAVSSVSFSARHNNSSPSREKSDDITLDLQDVVAAAQAAAESAEKAAAAARSAASLAQIRIAELTKKKNDQLTDNTFDNLFYKEVPEHSANSGHQNSLGNSDDVPYSPTNFRVQEEEHQGSELLPNDLHSYENIKPDFDSPKADEYLGEQGGSSTHHQPHRLPSMDEDSYFSYPNLFTSQNSINGSGTHSFTDKSQSTHDL